MPPDIQTIVGPQRSPARNEGIRERVTRVLAQRILGGEYFQSKIMPAEAELMSEFDVSRTVLREAVRTLVAKGLLETRQRTGTIVLPRDRWHLLDPDVLSWMSAAEPDAKFILDLTEARRLVEPAAAELAARVCTARDVASIEDAYHAMRAAAVDDLEASIAADLDFHQGILHASGNLVFANLGDAIGAALLATFRMTTNVSENYSKSLDAHGLVLDAIRMRQPDKARERMSSLLDIASSDLRKTLKALG